MIKEEGIYVLIPAAGKSSRMKNFKPLMKIGSFSMLEWKIKSFYEAGYKNFVIITGREKEKIEEHIKAGSVNKEIKINFIFNKNFESNEMLDSIKLGLEYFEKYMPDNRKNKGAFICPVDVAIFSSDTIKLIKGALNKDEFENKIIIPVFEGKGGHPVYIPGKYFPDILKYPGENGLKGYMGNNPHNILRLEASDNEILMDADTPEDFSDIEEYYYRSKTEKMT